MLQSISLSTQTSTNPDWNWRKWLCKNLYKFHSIWTDKYKPSHVEITIHICTFYKSQMKIPKTREDSHQANIYKTLLYNILNALLECQHFERFTGMTFTDCQFTLSMQTMPVISLQACISREPDQFLKLKTIWYSVHVSFWHNQKVHIVLG